jgi:hypothetical protein
VRARLLPNSVLQEDSYTRKAKEIIQSSRLTTAFPGEAGKERIITAYLNQIYYGHNAYGIAAAAQVYFGITDLNQLTPAQAALLAGLPQSPTDYDLFKFAQDDALGRLVVPTTAAPGNLLPTVVARRNYILQNLAQDHGRWTTLTDEQLEQALNEPIVLAQEQPTLWRAPHFIWHLKPELDALLASMGRPPADRGWLFNHHHARHEGAGPGRALHHRRSHRHPITKGRVRCGHCGAGTAGRQRVAELPARQGHSQRGAGCDGCPNGRHPGLRWQCGLTTATTWLLASSSRSSMWPAKASASPDRRGSHSSTPPASMPRR